MGSHSSSGRPVRGAGHGRHHRARRAHRIQPYTWLGAGVVTLGMGAALSVGSAVAHADDGSTSNGASASKAATTGSPAGVSDATAGDHKSSATPEPGSSQDKPNTVEGPDDARDGLIEQPTARPTKHKIARDDGPGTPPDTETIATTIRVPKRAVVPDEPMATTVNARSAAAISADSGTPIGSTLVSTAAVSAPAAGPRHEVSGGEVFLGGNYIELGLSSVGSFGTSSGKPEDFVGGTPPGSHPRSVGLTYDVDGFGTGTDTALDFYVPDNPEERWSVGFNEAKNGGFSALNGPAGNATTLSNASVTDGSIGNTLTGTSAATVDGALKVVQVHTFKVNDSFYKTTVTLTNVSTETLKNVEFMRSFDPDGTRSVGGSNTTVNTVGGQIPTEGYALVTAASLEGDAYDVLTGSRAVIFFYSKDPRATVYAKGFTNSNPYDFDDLAQATGYTTTADDAIGIVFRAGNLAPGASATFSYYTGATTDDDPALIRDETGSTGGRDFLNHLNDGVSLAGFIDQVGGYFISGVKQGLTSSILSVGGFLFGIRDMIVGHASSDPGTELSGLIDASSAVVSIVSAPIAIAAQLAKTYASFWVPISTAEQDAFLNFVSQCRAHKDLDELSSSQAQSIIDHYGGGFGLANLLSDYSRYKTRGAAHLFGGTGCP